MSLNENHPSRLGDGGLLKEQERSQADRNLLSDRLVWLFLAIGLVLRIVYNLALGRSEIDWVALIIDEREYFGAGLMLAEGRGFTFFDTALWVRPPLYVALLGILLLAGKTAYLSVLLVQSILSVTTLVPLGLVAYQRGGRTAARWCVGLGAIYLPFTLFSGLLLSETLFVFLLSWALLSLDRALSQLYAPSIRSGILWIVLAGFLLGLGTLTRATALALIPLSAIWVYLSLRARANMRGVRSMAVAGILLVVPILLIAPWAARNWGAYGRFIPIDTTSGYNLWLGSVGVRNEERLKADLIPIQNPGDRQAFALSRGIENIARDPISFINKGFKESLDLWRPLFSAEERQVRGYASGRVPAWHLTALLVLDDLLYLLILLAAAVGLVRAAHDPLRFLTLLWLASWVVVAFVFFAVTRFRLPVVAILLPWAGIGLKHFASVIRPSAVFQRLGKGQRIGLVASLLFVVVVVIPALPVGDTLLGLQRWQEQEPFRRGETLLLEGRAQEAIVAYQAASSDVTDTRYALAAAYLQVGDTQKALDQLIENEPPRRFEPLLIRGEAARRSGDLDAARSFFNERTVNLAGDEALRWAWDHFAPPLTTSIEVGGGLDMGYVRGFHSSEPDGSRTFRWSFEGMEVRGLDVSDATNIKVEMSGWRPDVLPPARLEIVASGTIETEAGGAAIVLLPKDESWPETALEIAARGSESAPVAVLRATVNPFIGSGADPRLLGVRVARLSVEP